MICVLMREENENIKTNDNKSKDKTFGLSHLQLRENYEGKIRFSNALINPYNV